jgi:hypothetical protein
MNPIQIQINEVNQKVDQLRDIVQQLGTNLSLAASLSPMPTVALATASHHTSHTNRVDHKPEYRPSSPTYSSNSYANTATYAEPKAELYPSSSALLEHKDILVEDYSHSSSFTGGDVFMTADIQIRRLTAQLTAAYNRIAALEEQLIATRFS